MTDMNRAGLLEIIAGKTRSNTAAAILSNTKDLEEAYKSAIEADGSALEENEKYLDSIQGRIDLFNNALQTFWNNLLESEAIKFFVNLGTQILELASAFGELRSIMFVVFTYLNLTKKMDLAKWIFGPKGLSTISKFFTQFTSIVKSSNKTKLLALPPPADTSSSTGGAPKTPSPSSPTSGYARLGVGTEPLDFDKIYGSKFSRMWQNHIARLKDSINRVKQDFTDIWQHHNERVAQSVKYASAQFDKLKNAFGKIFARNKVATPSTDVVPAAGGQDTSKQAGRFSKIWQNHIVRLKDSINRVKDDLSTIWTHHNERVKESVAYASKQFNKLKVNASKIFGNISKVVQGAASGIKSVFAKISTPVVKIFNGIANKVKAAMDKIKATASDTAKAFKERLGYTGSKTASTATTQQSISPYLDIFQNGFDQKQKLTYDPTELDQALDDLNNAWKTKGNAGVTEYISKLGEANNISKQTAQSVAAYASTVTDGGYSSQAASAYVKQHNAAVQASGVAARLAAIGHGILNAALSMGLSILLQFVFEGLGKLIEWIKNTLNPLEKLTEELSDMQSELSSVRSEIDSVNSELETTRERIAELAAMPSLSFTDQEELDRLKKLNNELEREKTFLTNREERLAETTAAKAQETVDAQLEETSFNGDVNSVVDNAGHRGFQGAVAGAAMGAMIGSVIPVVGTAVGAFTGAIIGAFTGIGTGIAEEFATNRISTEDKLNQEIQNYDDLIKRKRELEDQLLTADDTKGKFLWWETDSEYDKIKKELEKVEAEITETKDYIDTTLAEIGANLEGVGYGQGADEALDYYYTMLDKWEIAYGSSGAKASAIENLMSQDRFAGLSNSIDEWVQKLKDGDESARANIESLLSGTTDFVAELEARGMELQDAIDYFTLETGIFDSDTVEGITKQYAHGLNILNQLKNGNSFTIDGAQVNWDTTGANGLFDKDETGKFEARADKFAEILKGVDDTTRETFMHLAESVKNGTLTWEQAANSFQASGIVAACRLVEDEISNLNTEMFKDLGDELSGVIDTFSELGTALESVANSMEILNRAQTQYNNSGRISVKTALELMQSTDNWNDLLEIENGNITLVGGATEKLIEAKLDLIKKNLQAALATVKAQLAEVSATETSADMAYTIEESTNLAVQQLAGNMAYLTKLMEAYARQAAGETIDINDWIGQAEDAKATALAQTDYKKNSAVKIGTEALEQRKTELEAMLGMLEGIDTPSEFSDYYDYDKTPGDKDLDGSQERAADALEAIVDKFDRVIEKLDNQQTYIQNEIDIKEANGEAVSRSYYEEMIALENSKQTENINKRDAILAAIDNGTLTMTDDVAAALWEAEHAIQESTLRAIEFKQAITDLYVEASDKLIEAFDSSDDFLSDQQNFIDKYQELMELQGEASTASGFQEQIAIEQEKMADNEAELVALRQGLADAMEAGYIEEGSEEWVEYQDKIRAAEEAILDNKIAIEQYRDELNQLAVDAFDLVRGAFSNKDNFLTSQQDYIQGYIDLLEAQGIDVPEEVYQALIDREEDRRANFVADLTDARDGLDTIGDTLWKNAVDANPEMANWTDKQKQAWLFSQKEYVDVYNTIVETEGKIQDCDIATAGWEKTIRDMDFEKFDRFIGRLDDVHSEIDNVRSLFEDDDVANKDGTWTEEGITSLGLAYQQMELAQQKSQEYAEKIEELNVAYQNGEMSEQEYYERLQKLKDGQWGAIDAYEAAKDAIVDMEEARIDMIEEGINEEIEAYQELIETKKEELDAERDLYDFKKKVKDQTKDIAELDRRIASLSGSTADADIAQLRKLQAERRKLQEGLDDTFYQHSMDSQSKALDDDLASFTEIREDYLETLRDALDNTTAIITEKITEVLGNADTVMNTLNTTSGEYGVTLTSNLMAPWIAGAEQATAFKTTASEDVLSLINEEGIITLFGSEETKTKLTSVFGAGSTAANTFKTTVETNVGTIKSVVENSTSDLTSNLQFPWEDTTAEDGPISTFSTDAADAINGAVTLAKDKADDMFDWLSKPWEDMTADDGPLNTFSDAVGKVYDDLIQDAKDYVTGVNTVYNGIEYPDYTGSGSSSGNGGEGGNGGDSSIYNPSDGCSMSNGDVKKLQEVLNAVYGAKLNIDGHYGSATTAAVKKAQKTIGATQDGHYGPSTRKAMISDIDGRIKRTKDEGLDTSTYINAKAKLPTSYYAKGTLGTKQDGFAITDESWIGEEITLAAGKNGQLQYLKKGSAVMPADISANLVEWGKLNPNMMDMSNAVQGVNLMSSYVNKPEIKLDIENLLKVERVDKDTLPDLEKLMDKKLDNFARQLNYSIKKFAK